MMRPIKQIALLLPALLLLCGTAAAQQPLEAVTVQLSWRYQFQFAAFIAAREKGFYREAGLDVKIQEGGPGINAVDRVVSGAADYGVFSSALIVEYAEGKPVVALAALMQHSAVAIIARNNGQIHSIYDLVDKTIAVSPDTRDEIIAYLDSSGVDSHRVNIINKSSTGLESLKEADAISAYVSNEGFYLRGHEQEYLLFSPRSAGIDLFGNILFTSAEHLKKHKQQVAAFRTATLRGLTYALNHREEIVDLILAHYNTQHKTREHLLFEAEKITELTRPDIVEPGYMSPGRWRHVAEVYADLGEIPRDLDLSGFIYDPNARPDLHWLYWVLAATVAVLLFVSVALWQFGRLNQRLQSEIRERQQAEGRFRELFEKSPDPGWLTEENRLIECNQAAIEALGYPSKGALLALGPAKLSPPYQPDGQLSATKSGEMAAIAWERGVHRFEWLYRRHDGTLVPAEVTLARYTMERHNTLYCVWRDISERKRIDKVKDEFISTVSHELRTPLTSLIGALGLLAGGIAGELSEKSRGLLDIATSNARRLLSLINDILDISKIEAGRLEYRMAPMEVMPFIEQAIAANEHYGEKQRIRFKLGERVEGAWLLADSNRLMQVMYNLLSNAAKFSPAEATVEIDVTRVGSNVVIGVRDHGPGIPPEFHSRIFEKFSQADSSDSRRIGGTGLGLNISRRIVMAHHGTLDFESLPGEGSLFRVSLPEYSSPVIQPLV